MTIIMNSFEDWPKDTENDIGVIEWFRDALKNARCGNCGELVLDRKAFLWWRGVTDIIFCCDCAEHTLNGLNRDLAELKGDMAAKGKTGDRYSPILLKKEIRRLQEKAMLYLRKIVELQNMLGKPD